MKKNISIIFLLFLQFPMFAFGQNISIEKVEPPFWWTGMHHEALQLLVYGDAIAETTITLDYEGVVLKSAESVENPNYVFVNLIITDNAKAGKVPIKFTKGRKELVYEYELKKRTKSPEQRQPITPADVLYLIMPDRFANGNTENDNVEGMLEKADRDKPYGRHGGDLEGIIKHLDYCVDLGVTTIWLNPVFENNHKEYSYHGYAITDFYKTDPRFGTNADYIRFVDECHKKGLKVVKDMVFNHCGIGHWWMKDLPMKSWVNQFPEFTRSNFEGLVSTDPYASDYDLNLTVNGWFDKIMPDLNQKNEFLANYLIQNSIWWIEYTGIDGIRMDTYFYPDRLMMADWVLRVLKEYPEFFIVGETWLHDVAYESYWKGDKVNYDGYNSYLPTISDYPLYNALVSGFHNDGNIKMVYECLSKDFLYENPGTNKTFIGNHDVDRIFSHLGEEVPNFKMAMAFMLTTRGLPQIYYGDEILMTGLKRNGDGQLRKDFPGGWQGDEKNAFTAKGRTELQNEGYNFVNKILKWRKKSSAIYNGYLVHFRPFDDVYVYFRFNNEQKVMVLLNKNKEEVTVDMKRFDEMLSRHSKLKNILTGKESEIPKQLQIAPETPMIFEVY